MEEIWITGGQMGAKKVKRKQYFIIPAFQLKYIAYILLFLYLGAVIAGYTVYWTTWVTLGEKLANVYPRGRLIYIFRDANWTLFWRIVFLTPVFVLIGTFLSHRIAGPIYRIGKYIQDLKEGNYSRGLQLRKKDELQSIAKDLTELCSKLRNDKENLDGLLNGVVKELERRNADGDVIEKVKTEIKE